MGAQLTIVNNNNLSIAERQEIDAQIDQVISKHKNNRYEINKLVFESVSALTASENYSNELHSQGAVKKFFGGLTGKNRELQKNIDNSLARSQYASQQTLQKLAEQNLMSFELIAAVNNKLNASLVSVENEINNIYGTLVAFFKQSKSDIIQLENRVERLERNVNLLNWQNSIEYQMFNGVEYAELDDISKIVCLVRDFYDITKGQWTTSDLLLLKTAMATIDISPKAVGNYFDFVKSVCYNKTLSNKLFDNKLIVRQPNPEYLTMLSGINKLNLLGTKEHYVVDTVIEQVGQASDEKTISENLTKSYIAQEASVNIQAAIPFFDMMLETLYCLKQAEEESLFGYVLENESDVPLSVKYEKASELFRTYNPQDALPLLEDLSDEGYAEANVLLYWLYSDGFYENQTFYSNEDKGKLYLEKGYRQGDALCTILYGLYCDTSDGYKIVKEVIPQINTLAEDGNPYAEYILGLISINDVLGEPDYVVAVNHFIKSNTMSRGFYKAVYSIFRRYYNSDGPFDAFDEEYINIWVASICDYNCPTHLFDVAYLFMNSKEQMLADDEAKSYEELSFMIFERLSEIGDNAATVNLGLMYDRGIGIAQNREKAVHYYKKAADKGSAVAQYNLAICYKNGEGVEKDIDKAIYWFSKAAEQGYEKAEEKLNKLKNPNEAESSIGGVLNSTSGFLGSIFYNL